MKDRRVGTESQRTYLQKLENGFFDMYMSGTGLDIGYAGYQEGCLPILPTATGVDWNYPGYDGARLPFDSESQDYVYSSHCLEHIEFDCAAVAEWHRVVKVGGHLVIVVPHQYLYEKKWRTPSTWNRDHKRFYTPGELMMTVEDALQPNTYRVRLLEDGDQGFDYTRGPDLHSDGQYEITLVLQRISPPSWKLKP